MKVLASILLVLFVVTCARATPESSLSSLKDESGQNARFFIKSYSTRTWTFVSSFTSTVFYTCYTTNAMNACQGRRLRRSKSLKLPSSGALPDYDLSASLDDPLNDRGDDTDKGEKLFFTLWTTTSTTITITTFSTNRSVTVSALMLCTYPGVVFNVC